MKKITFLAADLHGAVSPLDAESTVAVAGAVQIVGMVTVIRCHLEHFADLSSPFHLVRTIEDEALTGKDFFFRRRA